MVPFRETCRGVKGKRGPTRIPFCSPIKTSVRYSASRKPIVKRREKGRHKMNGMVRNVCKLGTQDPENLDEEVKLLVTASNHGLQRLSKFLLGSPSQVMLEHLRQSESLDAALLALQVKQMRTTRAHAQASSTAASSTVASCQPQQRSQDATCREALETAQLVGPKRSLRLSQAALNTAVPAVNRYKDMGATSEQRGGRYAALPPVLASMAMNLNQGPFSKT